MDELQEQVGKKDDQQAKYDSLRQSLKNGDKLTDDEVDLLFNNH